MRLFFTFVALLAAGGTAVAQSHPHWWTYASPDATALVGIHWSYLRASPFAGAVAGELSPDGTLGFPDLPLILSAEEILISSPATLAIAAGTFPADLVAGQAAAHDLKPSSYKGVPLWISAGRTTLSVAQLSDQLLLFGLVPTLRDTIDRTLADKQEAKLGATKDARSYSPLLARAARFAKEDLWVVSSRLPDPLANLFIPFEADARSFEGSVSLWDGLHLVAGIEALSVKQAAVIADDLLASVEAIPPMADATEVTTDQRSIYVVMDLTEAQFAASMHRPATPEQPVPVVAQGQPAQPAAIAVASTAPAAPVAETERSATVTVVLEHAAEFEDGAVVSSVARVPDHDPTPPSSTYPEVKARKPRVIRILGLDSGPREIPMSPGNHPQ